MEAKLGWVTQERLTLGWQEGRVGCVLHVQVIAEFWLAVERHLSQPLRRTAIVDGFD